MPRVKTVDKEHAILEAASRVFAAKEFHEVLTEEIASDAGIGKGTIYRYFETKEELYLATIVHGFDALYAVLEASFEEPSPSRRLERIAREILEFSWHQRHVYMLLNRDEGRLVAQQSKLKKNRERIVRLIQKAIVQGIEAREFRGLDPKIGAELLLGMIRAANCYRRESDTLESLVSEVVSVFLRGIAREARR